MRSNKNLSQSKSTRSKSGSTLVEFALLAPVFFMMVTGLIEFVLYQYKVYALNHVVYEATRNLQTGEVQNSGDMITAFHDAVCATAGTMINCETIVFDVRNFQAIDDITFPPVVFDDDGTPTNFVFQPGGANRFSVVRAAMHHTFVTPFMAELMGMGDDLPAIVNSYAIVRNEPWA